MAYSVYNPAPGQAGILQSGQYSPRLEILQQEMQSGRYTLQGDIAALQRDIDRVFTGQTGDMMARPATVATPGYTGPVSTTDQGLLGGWSDWKQSFLNQWNNLFKSGATGATDTPGATPAIEGEGSFFGLSKYAGRAGIFLVGALLLVGAFLVYRK